MAPQILTTPVEYTIHGHGLRHDPAKGFGQEILALLGRIWPVIKANSIPNDGINRVVYECPEEGRESARQGGQEGKSMAGCTVFAGIILGGDPPPAAAALERKTIRLTRYAYWKHIGPYHLIPATGAAMTKALESRGLRTGWPMVEVYGHWTSDESKLETETFVALR